VRHAARLAAFAVVALVAAVALSGCSTSTATGRGTTVEDRPLRITTTVNFLSEAVREIGGRDVEVRSLMGPGVDPHTYKASARDVLDLRKSDAIVFGGLELEGKMEELLEELGAEQRTTAVTRALPRERLLREPSGVLDPHFWFDERLYARAVTAIRDVLVDLSPGRRERFDAGLRRHLATVAATRERVARILARVPRERRVLVTSHDAFAYFGRAHGFRVEAIQGISTAAEATTRDVQRIADLLVRDRLPAVFVESSTPRQTIDAVLAAARSGGVEARIGGELFADAAGEDSRWTSMVVANAEKIAKGLTP
jgi:manganese/zinc/iron transport system substrate-binding protein